MFSVSVGAYASAESVTAGEGSSASVSSKNSLLDRFAFKTNALEWLITIPNFGVEFDLQDSEYNNMTVGLTAKYNWNTTHNFDSWSQELNPGPPAVFNILDIRPEFRYYYRTVKATSKKKNANNKFDIERFLKEKKNARPWRAHYVGAYVNYGNYALKFGQRGYQGDVFGLGASAGYALPMYEYKRGFIDVELGFSVGLQLAVKDVFVHNPDGFVYMKVTSESKGLHMTPFPVVSEMRVAFAWRSKSIKDKVKEDRDKKRVKNYYETRVKGDRIQPLLDLNKEFYDTHISNVMKPWEVSGFMANDSLYVAGFDALLKETADREIQQIASAFPSDMEQHERQDIRDYVQELKVELQELIAKTAKETKKKFEKEYGALKAEKAKADAKAKAQSGTPEEKPEKTEKSDKAAKANPAKDKAEKPAKEKAEKVDKPKVEKEKPAGKAKKEEPKKEKVKKEKSKE